MPNSNQTFVVCIENVNESQRNNFEKEYEYLRKSEETWIISDGVVNGPS